jgi:alcohol dehydrogenase
MGGGAVEIETVGVPQGFELCTELVRPGAHVANIGVHGGQASPRITVVRDVTVKTGLVDT